MGRHSFTGVSRAVRRKQNVICPQIVVVDLYILQSAIRKKMAPRIAFWLDRYAGPRFTVFVWESDDK